MVHSHPGHRIFVLGAGFSVPAGLPQASNLFTEIYKSLSHNLHFKNDLSAYKRYRDKCRGEALRDEQINIEEFISYLDMEHYLGLRGSDTWSSEGNESQLEIKTLIGKIIHAKTPKRNELPRCYYNFAEQLCPSDIVLTFNYDTLLERALDHVGKPYRLFMNRFNDIGVTSNTIDDQNEEVIVLKMHGSVDWFSKVRFDESCEAHESFGHEGVPKHPIFDAENSFGATPIVDGPRCTNDPLSNIYRISNVDEFYEQNYVPATPFLLSPSHAKLVYTMPFLGFWEGMGRAEPRLGISIIGFSLPDHDEYVRLGLYQLVTNYQTSYWDQELLGQIKDYVKFVDFQYDQSLRDAYRGRYGFTNLSRASFFWDGFGETANEFLFTPSRSSKA